jgi:hypothetical protein
VKHYLIPSFLRKQEAAAAMSYGGTPDSRFPPVTKPRPKLKQDRRHPEIDAAIFNRGANRSMA